MKNRLATWKAEKFKKDSLLLIEEGKRKRGKMDKKAQGLSISTIILIILGVAVLVILILGFALGWDKIVPWINPSNNIAQVIQQCDIACTQGESNTYDYCFKERTIKPETGDKITRTCDWLALNKQGWGFKSCPIFRCSELPCNNQIPILPLRNNRSDLVGTFHFFVS